MELVYKQAKALKKQQRKEKRQKKGKNNISIGVWDNLPYLTVCEYPRKATSAVGPPVVIFEATKGAAQPSSPVTQPDPPVQIATNQPEQPEPEPELALDPITGLMVKIETPGKFSCKDGAG